MFLHLFPRGPAGTCTPLFGPSPRGIGSVLLASRRDEWASSGKRAVTEGLPACGPSSATAHSDAISPSVTVLGNVSGRQRGRAFVHATIMSAGYSSFGCQLASGLELPGDSIRVTHCSGGEPKGLSILKIVSQFIELPRS